MIRRFALALVTGTALVPVAALAQDLPTGGSVVAGQATIATPSATAMQITQGSDRAVIDWTSFSIGANARVDIAQPSATAALLNRVTGNATSTIAGRVDANGRVFLVNPNGIMITATGSINAAGFTASTLDTANAAFMGGSDDLTVVTAPRAGDVGVVTGGYAGLMQGRDESALLYAKLATVESGGATHGAIDFAGDGFLQVAVPQGGIIVAGRISANEVVLTAGTAQDAARGVVNLTGTIAANSVSGAGGIVTLTGETVKLTGATIDVSGATGGGTVRIGGDRQGIGSLAHATAVTVDAASVIRADATGAGAGNGGNITLWSDGATRFAGTISARGVGGGDGGEAEVSGTRLDYNGTTNLTGARFGTLLLDPYNLTISNAASSNQAGFTATGDDSVINATALQNALATANVTVSTGSSGTQAGDITVASALTWNSNSRLTLSAAGSIAVNAPITASGTAHFVGVTGDTNNDGVSDGGGALLFGLGPSGFAGRLDLAATSAFTLNGLDYTIISTIAELQAINTDITSLARNYVLGANIDAGATAGWNGGAGFLPIGTDANGTILGEYEIGFSGRFNGLGHVISDLTINRPSTGNVGLFGAAGNFTFDPVEIRNVGMVGNSVRGAYSVGGLIGSNLGMNVLQTYASGSVTAVSGSAGGLIGSGGGLVVQSYATGTVSGTYGVGGLAGGASGTIVASWSNATVTGGQVVGGLIGVGAGGSISDSYATGAVSGTADVGGLVGMNTMFVTRSHATGTVTGGDRVGGLVGQSGAGGPATISESYATGAVSGNTYVGGLVGNTRNGASVVDSHATNSVYGSEHVGGLVGGNGLFNSASYGSVGRSYATGTVSGAVNSRYVGGLVGSNNGDIYQSYATNAVFGGSSGNSTGGLIGTNLQTVSGSYASGTVTGGAGSSSVGGLIGSNDGTVSQVFATGTVSGASVVGGLIGSNIGSATLSYATGAVSGFNATGGLMGSNGTSFRPGGFRTGSVSKSYATGAVSGDSNVGGLVAVNDGSIVQSYASGAVTGSSNTGGLVGFNHVSGLGDSTGSVLQSHWDSYSTGQASAVGASSGGTISNVSAVTSDPTQVLASNYAFSAGAYTYFTTGGGASDVDALGGQALTWRLYTGNSYPLLKAFLTAANVSATGSLSDATAVYNGLNQAAATGSPSYTVTLAGGAPANPALLLGTTRPSCADCTNVGSYTVTTGLYSSQQGYDLIGIPALSATLSITARPITVTADALSRIYGDANPALTYTIGGNGLVNGDTLSGSFATGAAATSNVGSYAITQGTLAASSNYALTYTGANLSVTTRPITVTAGALSRLYGDANPALTYTIGGNGLINGDVLSGALAMGATVTSGVGVYGITQGTLAASSNYALTYTGANLSVTARPITVTADALTRIYGNANPALTYAIGGSGLVNGDSLSGTLATGAAVTSNVGTYGITQGTLAANTNYALTYTGANLSVTARPITVTADALTRLYGNANPALTYTIGGSGLVNGDTLSGALATGAGVTSNVGGYAITQGSLGHANYAVSYTGATFSVTARPITVTADALTRLYGNANPTLSYTVGGSGLVNGDSLAGALVTSAITASGVGLYAITQGTLANANYALTYTGANLSVTARPITVTADTLTRIYGNANPALTYTVGGNGLVNGDSLSGTLATGATVTSGVGSYGIAQGSLAASGNYALTYTGANLSVTARPITVTADALTRLYGNVNPALTYTVGGNGLVNGDGLTGALTTSAVTASNVGGYGIAQGTLAASGNYALTYTGATLSVTPRPITVTADALSRIYGNANPALTYTIGGGGLINGDTLSGALATGAGITSNVGSYAITQGTLANANYALTFTGATLGVTARPITVTADAFTRLYGNANPALTYTIGGGGLVNGDALSGSLTTNATTTSNVGAYGIVQGSLAASGNYALSYTGADLTVTARPITVTADALTRLYGDANPVLGYTVGGSGLVNGDSLSGALTTSASTTSSVGDYAITRGSLAASDNYALSYTGANLSVTPRSITVTADALSRLYGNANPLMTYTVGGSGLVNDDSLTGALTTHASATSNIGTYAITQGTLAADGNYTLSYAGANLSVTARPITVTADALTQLYGNATPALTYTVGGSGLVNGDSLAGALTTSATAASDVGSYGITQGTLAASSNYALTYAGANLLITARPITVTITADALSRFYGDANPALTYTIGGSGLVNGDTLSGSLATSATITSSVGTYAITQGTLANANYDLSYTGASLAVTARPITATAIALSRIYGNANPALTYTIGGSGLVNGDTLSGSLATGAAATSNVGSYAITQGTLAASANYALTYTGANLSVTARPITVTADALARLYGNANPALTYTIGGSGLVNGDVLTGALATIATTTSDVGAYGITQGSLAASSNYALTYTGASLGVTARPITVAADALTRIYGNANPALTYTVGGSGLVDGDTLSGGLATGASVTSKVDSYAITQGTLTAGSNYALAYTGANLIVTARPITVAADALSRIYGNANPALTYTVGGSGLVDGDTLSGSLTTGASVTSNVGSYAITQGTLANANYALSYTGANLNVTARPITVTADALTQLYGHATPALTYTVGGNGLVNGDSLTGALTTNATATGNVGTYAIMQGSLAASSNYILAYAGANLLITARPITVTITADALTRFYGDANPALTYTIGGSGLVNGDTLSGGLSTSATITSNVGSYAITQGTLANPNYVLSYTGADLSVTARPITVTADALGRIYGNANPALTYTVGGSGLVNGDTLSGGLATGAAATSNVGAYGILQGTLAANANYALSYTGANLSVTARPITVTADTLSRIYGNANPALTYTVGGSGLANGDSLSGALTTNASTTSNVGVYAITQGTLANANYALSYTGANLSVTPRAITVTADTLSRIYGNANPALTYTVGGSGLVNGDTLSGGLATGASVTSNVGSYAITQGTLAASANYSLTYTGANLTLTAPRTLSTALNAAALVAGFLPNLQFRTPIYAYMVSNDELLSRYLDPQAFCLKQVCASGAPEPR